MDYEIASTRSARPYQEDRILAVPGFDVSIYAVFDGHRGSQACDFAMMTCYNSLRCNMAIDWRDDGVALRQLESALRGAIRDLDEELQKYRVVSGTTACIAAVTQRFVLVANVGDSKAFLYSKRNRDMVKLSWDQVPSVHQEGARIEACGGVVDAQRNFWVCRDVCGNFGVTRALGNSDLRKFGMIPDPEFMVWPKPSLDKDVLEPHLVIASDGVFEKLSLEQVVQLLSQHGEGLGAARVVEAAKKMNTQDNVSLVVVKLWS